MHRFLFSISLILAALSTHGYAAETSSLLQPCDKKKFKTIVDYEDRALCGKLSVPEAEGINDRLIDLNVVMLPATTRVVVEDPLVLLAGGPGQAAVSLGAGWAQRFENLRKNRNILLVDQRGTGQSNSLSCELELAPTLDDIGVSGSIEDVIAAQVNALKQCLEGLDADPQHYHSLAAAEDLERVRQQLALPAMNLFGISYGTRMALVYTRLYPDSVRSLLLDAVAPTDMIIPLRVGTDADLAFQQIMAECEAQESCRKAFPNLPTLLRDAESRLAERKSLNLIHPLTGEREAVTLDPRMINRLLRGAMYSRDLRQLIPLALSEAAAGRWQTLVAIGDLISPDYEDDATMSIGMMASVLCSEDMTRVSNDVQGIYFNNALTELLDAVCPIWPSTPVTEDYFQPVKTAHPTLLMSGTLDPITPPNYAEAALSHLSGAKHLVVAGGAHGVSHLGCLPELIDTFLETLAVQDLDVSCVEEILPKPFFLGYAGPFSPQKETTAHD